MRFQLFAALAAPLMTLPVSAKAADFAAANAIPPAKTEADDRRAQRDLGLRYLAADPSLSCAQSCETHGVELLLSAARAGDDFALVTLARNLDEGGAGAPALGDLIGVEKARAADGDPVTAWRLARRYETGDGVGASPKEMLRWLEVAATADVSDFPKAKDAAYRLCQAYGRGEGAEPSGKTARQWCARAAGAGHAGAAIIVARLRSAND